jgi:hypothetical protein
MFNQSMRLEPCKKATGAMGSTPGNWHDQQAIERLAQHIPFETDPRTKAECIEMLREIVLRAGRLIDRELFGFEARQELQRLGLWERLGGAPTS